MQQCIRVHFDHIVHFYLLCCSFLIFKSFIYTLENETPFELFATLCLPNLVERTCWLQTTFFCALKCHKKWKKMKVIFPLIVCRYIFILLSHPILLILHDKFFSLMSIFYTHVTLFVLCQVMCIFFFHYPIMHYSKKRQVVIQFIYHFQESLSWKCEGKHRITEFFLL